MGDFECHRHSFAECTGCRAERSNRRYLNTDSWLVVLVCGEDLRLLGWYCAVSVDDLGHHTSCGLDSHRKGADIHQQDILGLQIAPSPSASNQENCSQTVWTDASLAYRTFLATIKQDSEWTKSVAYSSTIKQLFQQTCPDNHVNVHQHTDVGELNTSSPPSPERMPPCTAAP